jgi:hypothetical protein
MAVAFNLIALSGILDAPTALGLTHSEIFFFTKDHKVLVFRGLCPNPVGWHIKG